MAAWYLPPRRTLPVDALEKDGFCTRGYVQDVLDDGRCIVYFDRLINPLETVNEWKVYKVREFGWELQYDWTGKRGQLLGDGISVDVLIRWSPGASSRWYSGKVMRGFEGLVVDGKDGPDGPTSGIFNERYVSATMQPPERRTGQNFEILSLDVPESWRAKVKEAIFTEMWESQTKTRLESVDAERNVITLISREQRASLLRQQDLG